MDKQGTGYIVQGAVLFGVEAQEMCLGTNFIKTLELNELVNHIALLGCLDRELRLTRPAPTLYSSTFSSLFRLPTPVSSFPPAACCFILLFVFIYFFFSAAWKTIFVSKSVMSVEMNFRVRWSPRPTRGQRGARSARAWQGQGKLNEISLCQSVVFMPAKKKIIKEALKYQCKEGKG